MDEKQREKIPTDEQGPLEGEERDKFDELLADVPEWLRGPIKEYYRQILFAIAFIILVSALWSSFSYYTRTREKAASYQLGVAMSTADTAQKVKELQKILEKYSHTSAAPMAGLLLGQAYLDEGKYDKAADTFKEYASYFKGIIEDTALMGQGYAKEEKKELDSALASYDLVCQHKNGMEAVALIDKARILAKKGEVKQAVEAYNEYLDLEPASPFLDYIRYQVVELSNKKK